MDMRQLRYFAQIVESGSLAKASRQLFIAQPALSQQMARLEDEVGKPLLVRSSRGVTPTDHGQALYHHAKFLIRQLEQAVAVARRERTGLSGRVALGLAPTTVCQLGLALLRELRHKHPGIVLNIIEGHSGHLEHMARSGELDAAVLFAATSASDLAVEALVEEELFAILPASSPLVPASAKSIGLRELAALPLVLPSPGHGLRRRIAIEFERAGVAVDAAAEVDSLPLLMESLKDGVGVTIKPMSATLALGGEGTRDQWRCLRIADASLTRTNYLYTLAADKLSPCAEVVRDELRALVHRMVRSGGWPGAKVLGSDGTAFALAA